MSTTPNIIWTQLPAYNTLSSIAAGGALASLVSFAKAPLREQDVHLDAGMQSFAAMASRLNAHPQ